MHDPKATEDIAKQVEEALVEQALRAAKVDTRAKPLPVEIDTVDLIDEDDDDFPTE